MSDRKCDKCGGTGLTEVKVYRMPRALVIVGYALLMPAVILLLLAALLRIGVIGGTDNTRLERVEPWEQDLRSKTAALLMDIDGVQPGPAMMVETDGDVPPGWEQTLPDDVRAEVAAVLREYTGALVAARAARPRPKRPIGSRAFTALIVIAIPAFIVGLLLTRKKEESRCSQCGAPVEWT